MKAVASDLCRRNVQSDTNSSLSPLRTSGRLGVRGRGTNTVVYALRRQGCVNTQLITVIYSTLSVTGKRVFQYNTSDKLNKVLQV